MTNKTSTPTQQNGKPPEATVSALMPRTVADAVTSRVQQLTSAGELHLPKNYSAENALKAAWLAMQNSESAAKIMQCSRESMAEALLDMVIQGLNPAKDQCYFIPFGGRLVCLRSYLGSIALLRRIYGPKSRVWPVVVYAGDAVEKGYSRGRLTISKHELGPNEGDDNKVVAAYCVVEPEGEEPYTEWMTIEQIRKAWAQGGTKGNSPAHKGFAGEMAKKTVINRACKILIKSSDDSYLAEAIERQDVLTAEAAMDAEIAERANLQQIDIDADEAQISSETSAEEGPPSDAGQNASAEEAQQEATTESPPADRFAAMVDYYGMDPSKARKLVAEIYDLDDARKIINQMYLDTVEADKEFVSMYRKKFGLLKKQEPETETVDEGPDW